MQVLYPRCAGLDIHKKTVVACVLLTDADGTPQRFVRTFGTMTAELLALGDWLSFHDVTHVALESTGVLWRPLFTLLAEGRTLILVHAQQIKTVPGRKTDVKDSEWLADLLRHGLAATAQLCPSAPAPGPARSHAVPQDARRAAYPRDQSCPQGAGDGQPQTGSRRQ